MIQFIVFVFIFVVYSMEDPHTLTLFSKEGTEFTIPRHVASMRSPMLTQLLSISTIESIERVITFKNIGHKELKFIIDHLNQKRADLPNLYHHTFSALSLYYQKQEEARLLDSIDSPSTFIEYIHTAHFFDLPDLAETLIKVYASTFKNFSKITRDTILSQLPADSKNTLLQECYLRFDILFPNHPPEFTCSELKKDSKIVMVYREDGSRCAITKKRGVRMLSDIKLVIDQPNILKLNIKNQGLTVPPNLDALKDLIQIILEDNQLTSAPKISCCGELRRLNMAHNCLTKPPSLLWNVRLMYLDLSYNSLTQIKEVAILTGLRYLNLSHNKLKKLPSLRRLENLQRLMINQNNLTSLPVLPERLNVLNVRMNDLSAEELQHVESLADSVDFSPQKDPKRL